MNTHTHIHSNIIHSSQEVEAIKCPSKDEWIKTMWQIHTLEYYSALRKKSCHSLQHARTYYANERSQSQTDKTRMIQVI